MTLNKSSQIFVVIFIFKERMIAMCESNVYLKENEKETLIMESVDSIQPCENGLKLMDILGRQIFVPARIKNMTLLNHRIIIEKLS